MCLGALVDAGVPLKEIEKALKGLGIKGYRLEERKVKRASIAATKVGVIRQSAVSNQQSAKKWKDIGKIVKDSSLPDGMKRRGLRIFRRLFEAEGKVHGKAYNRTHLHELGAIDCIVDIFGTLTGLSCLGIEKVYSSAINLGSCSIITEHGTLPVPAPATAEILKGIPVYSSDIPFELTTPTGAAILREIGEDYGSMPPMQIEGIGYGAGQKDIKRIPNTLRILIGKDASGGSSEDVQKVIVIETNIDDMNSQVYEYVTERLFDAGAIDVFLSQVIMKKGRPGVVLTVLCGEETIKNLAEILFTETTTIGIRFHEASRIVLEREIKEVKTRFGKIGIKGSKLPDGTVKFTPEYEDCRRIARKNKVPLLEVIKKVNRL